jgi:imidazolonepropionase-like amidohydrolase
MNINMNNKKRTLQSTLCFLVLAIASLTMLSEVAVAQAVPGATQSKPVLLSGATIHTMSGEAIEEGELLFEDGKITAVGKSVKKPKGAIKIELDGKHVYPGMIESHSQMGLTEIAAVKATNDFREQGSMNPNVKALVSVYPDNVVIPVTRANGVLFALTAPTGGLISGKSAVIQLDGWTYEDMSVKPEAAIHINWPSNHLSSRRRARMTEEEIEKAEEEQHESLHKIRDYFELARAYRDARKAKSPNQKYDARLEAMIDVVDGKIPMMIRADRAADIQSAVAFAVEQELKLILLGGYDAELCADLLKRNDVPVIISAVYRLPRRRDDAYDDAYTLPLRLQKAGIKYCICGTDRSETWNARVLPYHAATAVGFGLPADEAMKAITLYPAEILGVADRIGSLEVGKDASLIVTDGSPLETTTNVLSAYIEGKEVDLTNRQLRLYKKYKQRYEQMDAASEGQ